MTFATKMLIAALTASVAFPAVGQRLPVGGAKTNKEKPKDALPQESATTPTTTTSGATSTTGRKLSVSPAAQKALVALQTAVNANDTATIPAKLAAAQAVAKSPDEKFFVASNQTKAALAANDLAAIRAGVDALQASGAAETPDLVARYTDLGKRYKAAGQNDQAAMMLDKAMALNPNSVATLINLASLRDAQGRKAEAVALMQKSFIASKAAGTKVDEGNYKFATGLAYGQRLPLANDLARQWYAAYPSPASLRDALRIYRDLSKPAPTQLIDLLRLARAANALSGESDFAALGSALVNAGKLAEAKALLADARSAPNVDLTKGTFTDLAKRTAAAPARAAIDASAKAALAGSSGKAMIDAGDALYGMGAFAEAAPLYRAALTKGGDAGLANLHLGMALARSGDKAGATAALNAATGVHAEVARYWLLWLATKG
jgi:tetratricopeptide (TPR) repeat protein